MQAPNLVQLEGWIHRFRDIGTILRAKGYGREAIRYFQVPVLQNFFVRNFIDFHTQLECLLD